MAMSGRHWWARWARFCQDSSSTLKSHDISKSFDFDILWYSLYKRAFRIKMYQVFWFLPHYLLCIWIYWSLQAWSNCWRTILFDWMRYWEKSPPNVSTFKISYALICPGVVLPVLPTPLSLVSRLMSPEVLMTSFQMPSTGQTCGTKVADGRIKRWFKLVFWCFLVTRDSTSVAELVHRSKIIAKVDRQGSLCRLCCERCKYCTLHVVVSGTTTKGTAVYSSVAPYSLTGASISRWCVLHTLDGLSRNAKV